MPVCLLVGLRIDIKPEVVFSMAWSSPVLYTWALASIFMCRGVASGPPVPEGSKGVPPEGPPGPVRLTPTQQMHIPRSGGGPTDPSESGGPPYVAHPRPPVRKPQYPPGGGLLTVNPKRQVRSLCPNPQARLASLHCNKNSSHVK
eukprot:9503509-Pyramimonas_sp.AAC.2